jgi:CMP-N-acetylneuraminic acid synthetase
MTNRVLCLIPARMGSERLVRKNLRELDGVPLVVRAIRKCRSAGVFDEIWVNSEHDAFGDIATRENVLFHKRPEELATNVATSEQYIAEFLQHHDCEWIVQAHSIAPLLKAEDVASFVRHVKGCNADVVLSYAPIQIECAYEGRPVNFTLTEKTNSQDLKPVQRVSWSITAWRREPFLAATERGECATYARKVEFYPVSFLASHVIKTEEDLRIAEALLPLVGE